MQAKNNSLTTITMATALIILLAQITLPIGPVPFSLLTVGVGLVASLLKPVDALFAGALYLLLGALGLPVFAGFTGGLPILIGATGGYLWGIPVYLFTTSYLLKGKPTKPLLTFISNFLGDSLLFLLGFVGLQLFANMDFQTAFQVGVLPFLLPDIIKLILITLLSRPIYQSLKHLNYFNQA